MKHGTMVRFTSNIYSHFGFGVIVSSRIFLDPDGKNPRNFYEVLINRDGELHQVPVSEEFIEAVQ